MESPIQLLSVKQLVHDFLTTEMIDVSSEAIRYKKH